MKKTIKTRRARAHSTRRMEVVRARLSYDGAECTEALDSPINDRFVFCRRVSFVLRARHTLSAPRFFPRGSRRHSAASRKFIFSPCSPVQWEDAHEKSEAETTGGTKSERVRELPVDAKIVYSAFSPMLSSLACAHSESHFFFLLAFVLSVHQGSTSSGLTTFLCSLSPPPTHTLPLHCFLPTLSGLLNLLSILLDQRARHPPHQGNEQEEP